MPRLFGRQLTQAEIAARTGRISQLGGIRPLRYDDGRARDVRAFDVRTGTGLQFTCVADRALDIVSAEYRGIPLAWHAPAGLAAPAHYDGGRSGFARSFFGGLLTTCGLTAFGPPGEDQWGEWGQHGRINQLPAEEVSSRTRWEDDSCIFEISGTVRETRLFGEDLRLDRTWRAQLGSNRIELVDRVINDGSASSPHMILYHCNIGFPLLAEDSRVYVSHRTVVPRDAEARTGLDHWDRGAPPDPEFAEQVFTHEPVALDDGWAVAAMVARHLNDERGLALVIRFRPEELPALFTWRMLGVKTYVMGLEPANCPTILGRVAAAQQGVMPFIEPGEVRTYRLSFEVLEGRDEIDALVNAIGRAPVAP